MAGSSKNRRPFWFFRTDGHLLLLVGLQESWSPSEGTWPRTFTIITTEADEHVADYHDRMPLIVTEELANRWLGPGEDPREALSTCLGSSSEILLEARAVSTAVNSVRNDYAELLASQLELDN